MPTTNDSVTSRKTTRQIDAPSATMNTPLSSQPFYTSGNFCSEVSSLRVEFEHQIMDSRDLNGGLTPLAYAFCDNSYQFLTAAGERLFPADMFDQVIEDLRGWAFQTLGLTHVSSPQARIYVRGCARKLLCDDSTAPWHYVLCLSSHKAIKTTTIRLLSGKRREGNHNLTVHSINKFHLGFNDLLVHPAGDAYSVDVAVSSMNPVDGAMLLDGYFW